MVTGDQQVRTTGRGRLQGLILPLASGACSPLLPGDRALAESPGGYAWALPREMSACRRLGRLLLPPEQPRAGGLPLSPRRPLCRSPASLAVPAGSRLGWTLSPVLRTRFAAPDTVRLARSRHPTLSRVVALCPALLARHGRRRHRLSPQPALQTLPHDRRSDLLPAACRWLLTWRLQILPLSPFGGGPCRVPTLTPGTLTLVLSGAQRKTGQEQGRGSPPFTPRLTPPGGSMARGPLSLWCAGWTSRMAS